MSDYMTTGGWDELVKERDALRVDLGQAINTAEFYNLEFGRRVAENAKLRAALEQIEQDTRNSSVVGHPGITCTECENTNKKAREALE